ncbi:class I SAM-dependent methyltransferase [Micromonospora sp. LOL_021]|uniref:class I SAM-dependent methyltransferase n=1 Tax=Micromonospora sp. LOL_021 TaxID=3345417 RepID=UPI003A8BBA31
MTSVSIDAAVHRSQQRDIWNAVAQGWERWAPEFEQGAVGVSDRLVQLAGLGAGDFVLDLGTGIGEPARTAAVAVGPTGRVLGVDLSPEMVAIARRRSADVHNVAFAVADESNVDVPAGGFDAVLSRWVLPFTADRIDTLRRLARMLRPGGVLAAAVWARPPAVPMISLGFSVISRELRLDPPPPGQPGPFSMSDAGQVADELRAAGFTQIAVTEYAVPFVLASVADFVAFTRDVLPPRMRELIERHRGTVDDPNLWRAVAEAAEAHADEGGVRMTSTTLLLRAVTPGRP